MPAEAAGRAPGPLPRRRSRRWARGRRRSASSPRSAYASTARRRRRVIVWRPATCWRSRCRSSRPSTLRAGAARSPHRLRGRAPARRRQARGDRRPSVGGPRAAARSSTGSSGTRIAGGEEAERPGIVHRLDRDTSGLLVVARSDEAHRRLQRLLRQRKLVREYLALVRGRPRSRRGRIEAPIGRDRGDPNAGLPRHGHPARGRHELRGHGDAAPARAPAGRARDGKDAPDPRASRRDRPSGRGRPRLRRRGRPRPRATVPPRGAARVPAPHVAETRWSAESPLPVPSFRRRWTRRACRRRAGGRRCSMSPSGSDASVGRNAAPALAEISSGRRSCRRVRKEPAVSGPASMRSAANSSPPRRPMESVSRAVPASAEANARSSRSPSWWPSRSFVSLKRSRSKRRRAMRLR